MKNLICLIIYSVLITSAWSMGIGRPKPPADDRPKPPSLRDCGTNGSTTDRINDCKNKNSGDATQNGWRLVEASAQKLSWQEPNSSRLWTGYNDLKNHSDAVTTCNLPNRVQYDDAAVKKIHEAFLGFAGAYYWASDIYYDNASYGAYGFNSQFAINTIAAKDTKHGYICLE